jgi:hypothetical protein
MLVNRTHVNPLKPEAFDEPFAPLLQRYLIGFPTLATIKEEPATPTQEVETDDEDMEELATGNSIFLSPKAVTTVYSPDQPEVKTRVLTFDFTRQCSVCSLFKPTFSGKFVINPNVIYMPYQPSRWTCADCFQ